MTMSIAQLREVRALAKEVHDRIGNVLADLESQARDMHQGDEEDHGYPGWLTPDPSRQTGTLRRRTMDLTRALADLRRP